MHETKNLRYALLAFLPLLLSLYRSCSKQGCQKSQSQTHHSLRDYHTPYTENI